MKRLVVPFGQESLLGGLKRFRVRGPKRLKIRLLGPKSVIIGDILSRSSSNRL